jgi:hypothetical protein
MEMPQPSGTPFSCIKRLGLFFGLLLAATSQSQATTCPAVPATAINLSTLKPTLDDEFKGTLNCSIWSPFFPVNQTFGMQSFMPDEYTILPIEGLCRHTDHEPQGDGDRDSRWVPREAQVGLGRTGGGVYGRHQGQEALQGVQGAL